MKQLSYLSVDKWYQLGIYFGLSEDQLEEAKTSTHPTTAILHAAKLNNQELKWSQVVEALVRIGEYELAESVCNEQGELVSWWSICIHSGLSPGHLAQ